MGDYNTNIGGTKRIPWLKKP